MLNECLFACMHLHFSFFTYNAEGDISLLVIHVDQNAFYVYLFYILYTDIALLTMTFWNEPFVTSTFANKNCLLGLDLNYVLLFANYPRRQYIQGGPAKVRPTLLVTFECIGKIQWFLAIWRTILNIKFLRFPRCVSKLLSHLPKNEFTYAFKCYQNNVTSKNVSWPHFSWATLAVASA